MKSIILALLLFSTVSFASNNNVEIRVSPIIPIAIMKDSVRTTTNNGVVLNEEIIAPWTLLGFDITNSEEEKLTLTSLTFHVIDPIYGTIHKAEKINNLRRNKVIVHNMVSADDITPYMEKNFSVIATFEGWFEVDGKPVRDFYQEKKFTVITGF